jgi:hypothetical protein
MTQGERIKHLERKLDALQAHQIALVDAIVCAFGAAGVPPPASLREPRPALRVIDGGRR